VPAAFATPAARAVNDPRHGHAAGLPHPLAQQAPAGGHAGAGAPLPPLPPLPPLLADTRRREPAHAATRPDHPDERLRGRTLAIPFEDVWQAALALADGGLRGWRLLHADDREGVIAAEAKGLIRRAIDDVEIRVALDSDAQTRIDAFSVARRGRHDFGANARRLRSFFQRLDKAVLAAHAARRGSR
jgi:hypothetical protein